MDGIRLVRTVVVLQIAALLVFSGTLCARNSRAWSNGGKSSSAMNPDYGTHDWIAEHALEWLPAGEKQYLLNNLDVFLYGTELPDFSDAVGGGGIGDTQKHHVYYRSDGRIQDDSAAVRARSVYSEALGHLRAGNLVAAARSAGTLSHYIDDLAAFPHVMGTSTDWGVEVHHQDYETYVNDRTSSYSSSFATYLTFDGNLETLSAYDAVLRLAHDTTFDDSGNGRTAPWMDANYNWGDASFSARVGRSLTAATNVVADVLHTLWNESGRQPDDPMAWLAQNVMIIAAVMALAVVAIVILLRSKKRGRNRRRRR